MLYFIADCHFSQQRTLEMSRRPFKNVKEMDLIMLMNWNSVVKPNDTVYILGDVGYMDILPLLNGKKILIKGNYERERHELLDGHEDQYEEIYDYIHEIDVKYKGKEYHISMAHEPSRVRDKVISETNLVCFGHIHKLCMVKRYGLCVSADAHNFTPLSLDDIIYYHDAILNYYDENVFF